MTMDKPCWAEDLQPKGVYFEGFVDDATAIVERYKSETLNTFGTRTSELSHVDPEKETVVRSRWMQTCSHACTQELHLCDEYNDFHASCHAKFMFKKLSNLYGILICCLSTSNIHFVP